MIAAIREGDLELGANLGKFRIVREVGRGGMGVVYEAVDTTLDRRVAVKVLLQPAAPGQEERERFLREATLAAKLRHPNIVSVHEAGVAGDLPYFTMDFVEGTTLDRKIDSGEIELRTIVEILRKTAQAVQAAHEANVIHRDLKPANVILDDRLEPHVTDFGLAKDLHSPGVLTLSGTAVGTPCYMSPEQASGVRGAVDARSDVYSLGVMLYQGLTRKLPFYDESLPAILVKVTMEDPVPPRAIDASIDRGLERVCLKAMAREKRSRYVSAGEMAEDLGRWLRGEPVLARPPSAAARVARVVRRNPTFLASVAVTVLVTLAVGAYLFLRPGTVKIENPSGATVEIDGKPVARGEATLKRGKHRLQARLGGCREIDLEFHLAAGEVRTLDLRMEPRAGQITFEEFPRGTHVTLWSGPEVREFETPIPPMTLGEGTVRLRCWAPGTAVAVFDVAVRDRETGRPTIDLRDALLWRHAANDRVDRALAVGERIAAISKDRFVRILDPRGKLVWSFDTRNEGHTDPVWIGGDLVFGVGTGGLQCLRGEDGASRYFYKMRNRAFVSPAAPDLDKDGVADPVVTNWEGEVACLSGRRLQAHEETAAIWERSVVARAEGPALVGPEDVIVVTHASEVAFLSLEKGEDRGRVALPAEPCSPATLADADGDMVGDVLVGLEDGRLVCVSRRSVGWAWKCGGPVRTRPAAADLDGDGRVEVVTGSDDGHLYCVNGKDGSLRWKFRAAGAVRGSPILGDVDADGATDVVFGSDDDRVYVVDGRTGRLGWSFTAGGDVSSLALADLDGEGIPEILFGAGDGIYAVQVRAFGTR